MHSDLQACSNCAATVQVEVEMGWWPIAAGSGANVAVLGDRMVSWAGHWLFQTLTFIHNLTMPCWIVQAHC